MERKASNLMNLEKLEIISELPLCASYNPCDARKFGSYYGELVLISEYLDVSPSIHVDMSEEMKIIQKRIGDNECLHKYLGVNTKMVNNESQILTTIVAYPEGGFLTDLIFGESLLGWRFKFQVMLDIAKSIFTFHNSEIIHSDINIAKFGFDVEWKCKLLDYIVAVPVEDAISLQPMQNSNLGDKRYQAPEVVNKSMICSASDIYSFGLVMFEICTRTSLLTHARNVNHSFEFSILEDDLRAHGTHESLIELIRQSIQEDWTLRPTIEDAIDWMQSIVEELHFVDEPPHPILPPLPFENRRQSASAKKNLSLSPKEIEKLRKIAAARDTEKTESESDKLTATESFYGTISQKSYVSTQNSLSSEVEDGIITSKDLSSEPNLNGILSIKAHNLPYYKKAHFFFRDGSLVWSKDGSTQGDKLHYFELDDAIILENTPSALCVQLSRAVTKSSRLKLFGSLKVKDSVKLKFSNAESMKEWVSVFRKEANQPRCKMCYLRVVPPDSHDYSALYCSLACYNYNIAISNKGFVPVATTGKVQLQTQAAVSNRRPSSSLISDDGDSCRHDSKLVTIEDWLASCKQEHLINTFHEANYSTMLHLILGGLVDEDFQRLGINDDAVQLLLKNSLREHQKHYWRI